MGEVFRARDTRLERSVAIKILPAELASNALFRVRFEREAKTISQLNHPHICTLHDVGQSDGTDYLVMELLEGETLADRLSKGPLPLDQVLRYGTEIAGALDRAHRAGIVHRDLKPGNVMLTKAGAKLLDFGLAKEHDERPAALDGPTVQMEKKPLTEEGTIVGTFQYMAPEQIEGKPVDARTDIFALGVMLYEMATGRRAFTGRSRASLSAAILVSQPAPLSSVLPVAPAALDRIVRICLEKDPDDRWQSAHDVGLELRGITETAPAREHPRRKWAGVAGWIVALIAVAAATWLAFRSPKAMVAEPISFAFNPPPGIELSHDVEAHNQALSPDGRWLLWVGATTDGHEQLYLHDFRTGATTPVPETTGALSPFWSPDGTKFGFFADGKLRVAARTGGPSEVLADVSKRSATGTWSKDGTILFSAKRYSDIASIPAAGGTPTPVLPDQPDRTFGWPYFLPDGKHFLIYDMTRKGENFVSVGTLGSKDVTRIVRTDSAAIYADGFLLYGRDERLLAQPFDAASLRVTGEPVVLASDIPHFKPTGYVPVAGSSSGRLLYEQLDERARVSLVDREGKRVEEILPPGRYGELAISPDGKSLAFEMHDPRSKKSEIWIHDLDRKMSSRFTINPEYYNSRPRWSPDGTKIVWSAHGGGQVTSLRIMSAGETGGGRTLVEKGLPFASAWRGDTIYFDRSSDKTQRDAWSVPATPGQESKAAPIMSSEANEGSPTPSPDGAWLAYVTDETGKPELFVKSLRDSRRWPLGPVLYDTVRWSAGGQELFYADGANRVMSIAAADFARGTPRRLFDLPNEMAFDVMPDGRHFVITETFPGHRGKTTQVVIDWPALIRR